LPQEKHITFAFQGRLAPRLQAKSKCCDPSQTPKFRRLRIKICVVNTLPQHTAAKQLSIRSMRLLPNQGAFHFEFRMTRDIIVRNGCEVVECLTNRTSACSTTNPQRTRVRASVWRKSSALTNVAHRRAARELSVRRQPHAAQPARPPRSDVLEGIDRCSALGSNSKSQP
jgi:hypothetical protein